MGESEKERSVTEVACLTVSIFVVARRSEAFNSICTR